MLLQPRFSSRHHNHIEHVMRRRERKYPFLTGIDLTLQIGLLVGMLVAVVIVAFLAFEHHGGTLSAQASWFASKLLS